MAVLLAIFYLRYQRVEYNHFDKTEARRRIGMEVVDDWPRKPAGNPYYRRLKRRFRYSDSTVA